jgi:hypothetical protein
MMAAQQAQQEAAMQQEAQQIAKAKAEAEAAEAQGKARKAMLAQIASGASVADAKTAFSAVMIERLSKENAALKASAPAPAPVVAAPVVSSGAPALAQAVDTASAVAPDFMAAARQYKDANKCTMTAAMSAIAKANPKLHEDYRLAQIARSPEVRDRKRQLGMK